MAGPRTPARDAYDAAVDLLPWQGTPTTAVAFVKHTYRFDDLGVHHAAPEPLVGELRDRADRQAHLTESDFVPYKPFTDVVVLGHGYPRPGDGAPHRDVEAQLGNLRKRLRIHGRRLVRGHLSDAPRIEGSEPLAAVPLTRAEAYGGRRPPTAIEATRPALLARLTATLIEPEAVYPRNPDGKGYWHPEWAPETLELPRVEDPTDAITMERLREQPRRPWFEAPLPWHLDWMGLDQFPRFHPLPGPTSWLASELPEVARSLWPREWLDRGQPPAHHRGALFRACSLGMAWADPRPGAPIAILGMHPERDALRFALPSPPHVILEIEGTRLPVEPRLHTLLVRPDDLTFSMTWVATSSDLPRRFVPGVHAHIPLRVSIDGDKPIEYMTPPRAFADAPERRGPSAHPWATREPIADRSRDQVPHQVSARIGHVDPTRGRVLWHEVDYHLATHVPLTIERFYSSSMSWRGSALGPGWAHPLEQALWQQGDWLVHRTHDGSELAIPLRGTSLAVGAVAHHTSMSVRRLASDRYAVEHADGRRVELCVLEPQADGWIAKVCAIQGFDGASLQVRYDTHSMLDRVLLPGGGEVRYEHDDAGRLIRITVPSAGRDRALVAAYEHDEEGQLRSATSATGERTTYRYRSGRLTERIPERGDLVRFEYEREGERRCIAERWGDAERTLHFDAARRRFNLRTATGGVVGGHVDGHQRITTVRDALGVDLVRAFDEATGLLGSITSAHGQTTFLYDAEGHLSDVSAPDEGSIVLEHDGSGRVTELRDADGNASFFYWHHEGGLAGVERAGVGTVYERGEGGAVQTVRLPWEATLALERDPSGQAVVTVRSSLGDRHARLDPLGRVVEVRDELGGVHELAYAATGHVETHRLPGGVTRSFVSDGRGRVLGQSDGADNLTIERDGEGRLSQVDEGGEGPRIHRDAEGRVTVIESETFDYWELTRDGQGRVTAESGFDGERRSVVRDRAGRITRSTRGRFRTLVERDAAGRPVALEHSDGSFQRFGWSPAGRMIQAREADRRVSFAWDRDRLARESTEHGELTSVHDALGHRTALRSPLGLSLRVERDALGNATKLTAQLGARTIELRFERDVRGNELSRQVPGPLGLRFERDPLGRITRRTICSADELVSSLELTYAGISRVVRTLDSRRGVRELVHDPRGRLVRVGGLVRALDALGRVYRSPEMDDQSYEGLRLVEAYGDRFTYDDAGRRTERRSVLDEVTRYDWDGLDRLIAVYLADAERVAYDYDALGRMVRRRREHRVSIPGIDEPVWECTLETELVWDGLALLHEREGDRITTWIREAGQLVAKLSTDGAWAVFTDPAGVPTELVDEAGVVAWRGSVDLYGSLTPDVERTTCSWRHAGHWEDPDTGLHHSWLRVYDPATGGYLSPTPLGLAAGSNLYEYSTDPVSETSPLGLARGYATLGGEVSSPWLEAELVHRFIACLDRRDGTGGPRRCFDRASARWRLPDPTALLFGDWDRYRPSRNMPEPSSVFTDLPWESALPGR